MSGIHVNLRVDGEEKLDALYTRVKGTAALRVKKMVMFLSYLLSEKIVTEKLSGQYLNQRTGRLAGSIHPEFDETISTFVGRVGTNVEYAAIHEYGYQGPQEVKAHMRMMKMAWGRPMKNPREVMVRAHTRYVDVTEKRYMRDSLAEFRPTVSKKFTELANSIAEDANK